MELDIADALWKAVQQHGHLGLELEYRLGRVVGGHFCPNVGKDQFAKLKKIMDASKFETFFIETVENIECGVKHVTTCVLTEAGLEKPPPPNYCMRKSKLFQADLAAPGSPYSIRCSVALETSLPLQPMANSLTRHKRRWRYRHKHWVFDLTEVVSNTDIDEEESYEVEIELLDVGLLFERTMDATAAWGLKLAGDMVAMLHSK